MTEHDPHCWSCQHLLGKRQIQRAPRIHEGSYWNIEHVPDTSISGWIVIVLKRHAEAMHSLTDEEWNELSALLRESCQALNEAFASKKEYVMQFAEADHLRHVHVHVVPIAKNWPFDLRGPKVFAALGDGAEDKLPDDEMTKAAGKIRRLLAARLGDP